MRQYSYLIHCSINVSIRKISKDLFSNCVIVLVLSSDPNESQPSRQHNQYDYLRFYTDAALLPIRATNHDAITFDASAANGHRATYVDIDPSQGIFYISTFSQQIIRHFHSDFHQPIEMKRFARSVKSDMQIETQSAEKMLLEVELRL